MKAEDFVRVPLLADGRARIQTQGSLTPKSGLCKLSYHVASPAREKSFAR